MSDSTRYFQLTPDILVEYGYNNLSSINDQAGNVDHVADLEEGEDNFAYIINNGFCGTRNFYWSESGNNYVLPVNMSESKFVSCKYNDLPNNFIGEKFTTETEDDDILIDKFRLHFTSRNFIGSYDGCIISLYVYNTKKNKVGLLSEYIRKIDDPNINENPVMINQKLYTTYRDFKVPNIVGLFDSERIANASPASEWLRGVLFPKNDIMENSPLVMCIYGVKNTYTNNGREYYNVEKLNTIYIPIVDKSNRLSVKVEEAKDGDYFDIHPLVDNGRVSFSDYIYNISDGHPEQFIVFYELKLIEHYVDRMGNLVEPGDVTHREQYIINAAQEQQENQDTVLEMNERELDGIMYYRPVVLHSAQIVYFTIDVTLNIINTYDNTTIVKRSSIDYCPPGEDPQTLRNQNSIVIGDPKKYGKKMNKIYLGEIPAKVNVYNKKPNIDIDGVKLTNASSKVKIENHQHSVIGFIECANVGVSIEQIPSEVLNEN